MVSREEAACVVRMDAAEPVERRVAPVAAPVVRMMAVAGRVRLPDLDEGIGHRLAGAVADRAVDNDALARCVVGRERQSSLFGDEDREERADGLEGV